ncbi:GTP cyclohydrolase I FolE [Herminiimonas sp. KBW02]|uniref:GTP cyclohydrolase I FolE n=1 Tax=Herminiimonas sp. KBW02 TaxID=2153363 RepID=UPI003519FCB0
MNKPFDQQATDGVPLKQVTNTAQSENDDFSTEDWRRLLTHLGENADRQGLRETPQRVEKAWKHWTSGYDQDPADILKVFEDGAEQYNELIVVRGIPVYSHCEHHLAPFFGTATIGYTPNGKIVGLSKLTRLVDCFAKRLQVQERLTIQIADTLMEHVQPLSVGVVIRCRHMCMESRGIRTPGEETVTSALLGEMRTNLGLRNEFMMLAREKD